MQRWRSAAAAEHDAENESLARPRAARHVVQSRRGRRAHHMVGRRCQAFAAQERRRQLSVLARSTRSAWARAGDIGRVGGDQMAAAERPDRTPHRPPPRSLRHHRRGQGGSEVSRGSGLGARGSRLGACGSIAVLAGLLAFAVACESRAPSPESRATRPESRAPERAVSMPDISGAAPAVQAQLRDAYSALQQKIAPASSPADERAVAYGDMGRLFFATEYLDAAETCFLNAQTLQPNEMRWPYFLAHVHRRRNEPGKAATLFERVLALEPNNVPALVWLGDMRLVEGRPDAAEAPLAKALTPPRWIARAGRRWHGAITRPRPKTSALRSRSSRGRRACITRSRSPIAGSATHAMPMRSSDCAATSTSRPSTRSCRTSARCCTTPRQRKCAAQTPWPRDSGQRPSSHCDRQSRWHP